MLQSTQYKINTLKYPAGATHLVLGPPLTLSDVGGDNPLRLLPEPRVGIELKGNTKTKLQSPKKDTHARTHFHVSLCLV